MSLNKFMHPRNRYKSSKPSFLHLALKYPQFRAHTTQDEKGKVLLDFKNADALRALTTCLLKEDFGLTVELPQDRLVPTLPLRLNYIHWLEDIVGTGENIWGIDVGTGASCIYPILAAKMNKWHFLATEADTENAFFANKNVNENGFQDLIQVKQVSTDDVLLAPVQKFTACIKFDFCMCNPPFFADHMEAQAITATRSVDRPDSNSLSTASPQECIAQGGEVGFVRQMIDESAVLRDKIRVYTSMVGKKSSVAKLKAELLHQKVAKFSTTEFCQGKTMRWGIAWTYDSSVTFPRSEFESRKEKPPLQYMVPKGAGGVEYKVHEIASYLKKLLQSIKVHCYQGKTAKSYTSITITATENTWCHQRRLRRQQRQKQQQENSSSDVIIEAPGFRNDPAKDNANSSALSTTGEMTKGDNKSDSVVLADDESKTYVSCEIARRDVKSDNISAYKIETDVSCKIAKGNGKFDSVIPTDETKTDVSCEIKNGDNYGFGRKRVHELSVSDEGDGPAKRRHEDTNMSSDGKTIGEGITGDTSKDKVLLLNDGKVQGDTFVGNKASKNEAIVEDNLFEGNTAKNCKNGSGLVVGCISSQGEEKVEVDSDTGKVSKHGGNKNESFTVTRSIALQGEDRIEGNTGIIASQGEDRIQDDPAACIISLQATAALQSDLKINKINNSPTKAFENSQLSTMSTGVSPNSSRNLILTSTGDQIHQDNCTAPREEDCVAAETSPKEYILKCVMRLKRVEDLVQLELEWLDGKSRELMHQIMTYLQNKLRVG